MRPKSFPKSNLLQKVGRIFLGEIVQIEMRDRTLEIIRQILCCFLLNYTLILIIVFIFILHYQIFSGVRNYTQNGK